MILPQIVHAWSPEPQALHGALSRSLERQVLELARAAGIQALAVPEPDAPTNLPMLRARAERFPGGILVPVSAAHSERTVWSRPAANWLFRAWHDSIHLDLDAPFDPFGEWDVSIESCKRIQGAAEREVLRAEVWGQVSYYELWGVFPAPQRAFVVACVRDGIEETVFRGRFGRVD